MIHFLETLAKNYFLDIADPEKFKDFDTNFMDLPFHVYIKDKKGKYLGSNKNQAIDAGFEKGADVLGLYDHDLAWSDFATVLRTHDIEVMTLKTPHTYMEQARTNQGCLTGLSYKCPLMSRNDTVLGMYGLSFIIDDNLRTSLAHCLKHTTDVHPFITTTNKYNLSPQQYECLYYLTKGMTLKEIAQQLNLSWRTVEHYLDAVKDKLQCKSRVELIIKGIQLFKLRDK